MVIRDQIFISVLVFGVIQSASASQILPPPPPVGTGGPAHLGAPPTHPPVMNIPSVGGGAVEIPPVAGVPWPAEFSLKCGSNGYRDGENPMFAGMEMLLSSDLVGHAEKVDPSETLPGFQALTAYRVNLTINDSNITGSASPVTAQAICRSQDPTAQVMAEMDCDFVDLKLPEKAGFSMLTMKLAAPAMMNGKGGGSSSITVRTGISQHEGDVTYGKYYSLTSELQCQYLSNE